MDLARVESKYLTKTSVLFIFGILAHILAGGSVVETRQLLLFLTLIFLGVFCTRKNIFEGPQLALMILIMQSAGHFLLGGADRSSDVQMSAAHLFSGFLSYKLVLYFDQIWNYLQRLVEKFQIPIFHTLAFATVETIPCRIFRTFEIPTFISFLPRRRGPPIKEYL